MAGDWTNIAIEHEFFSHFRELVLIKTNPKVFVVSELVPYCGGQHPNKNLFDFTRIDFADDNLWMLTVEFLVCYLFADSGPSTRIRCLCL